MHETSIETLVGGDVSTCIPKADRPELITGSHITAQCRHCFKDELEIAIIDSMQVQKGSNIENHSRNTPLVFDMKVAADLLQDLENLAWGTSEIRALAVPVASRLDVFIVNQAFIPVVEHVLELEANVIACPRFTVGIGRSEFVAEDFNALRGIDGIRERKLDQTLHDPIGIVFDRLKGGD